MPGERSTFERHAQTVIGVILIGLIGWVGTSVTSSLESIARLEVHVTTLQSGMAELKDNLRTAGMSNVPRTEIESSMSVCRGRISSMEQRFLQLLQDLKDLEERVEDSRDEHHDHNGHTPTH